MNTNELGVESAWFVDYITPTQRTEDPYTHVGRVWAQKEIELERARALLESHGHKVIWR